MSKSKNSKKTKLQQHAKPNLKDIKISENNTIKVEAEAKSEGENKEFKQSIRFNLDKIIELGSKFKKFSTEKREEIKINFKKIDFAKLKNIKKEDILKNKKACAGIAVACVLVISSGFLAKGIYDKKVAYEIATRAYDVIVDGESIGFVREKNEVENILNKVKTQISAEYGIEAVVAQKVEFVDAHAEDNLVLNSEELESKVREQIDVKVWAYGVQVDGNVIGYVKTEAAAWQTIADIEKPYKELLNKENSNVKKVETVESVQITKEKVNIKNVMDYEKLLAKLKTGSVEEKIHTVQDGESYWAIANKYNITVEDLIAANPGNNPELVQIGDELSLIIPKPYVSVATYETAKIKEKIPFEVKSKEASNMYKNEKVVVTKGQLGERQIVADIKKVNGIEIEKVILEEQILKAPVAEVVSQGTKPVPSTKGTGKFLPPANAQIASRYGWRTLMGSRNFHQGVDFAARLGNPVKAADGGVVTFAGWKNAYGYMVEIDHGAGFKTRYAHNSKLYVKKGDRVFQGKTIAAVGNTGRSTGPHLHFEVWKNGATQNPSNYLNKVYK